MTTNANPFIISGYAGPEYFCDREQESAKLIQELLNGNYVALISPRRMGKTGLIQHCFQKEEFADYYTFFIDIYATKSLREMVFAMSKTILEALKPKGKKALETFVDYIKSLQPGISFDLAGNPTFNLQLGDIHQSENTLDEIFKYLEAADRPCIVAIDEFQQIAAYPETNIEALLRTYVQRSTNANFIFAGSQRHIMGNMFTSPSRPFYQSVSMMQLGQIDIEKYSAFAAKHFSDRGKTLAQGVVEAIWELFDGITWYVQIMLNSLFSKPTRATHSHQQGLSGKKYHLLRFYQDLRPRLGQLGAGCNPRFARKRLRHP